MSKGKVSKGEIRMREMLAELFPGKAVRLNYRPIWLRGCELDVYYPGMQVAFEFNGAQHTRYVPHFHKRPGDLGSQLERDAFKAGECKSRGVRLIIVEHEHTRSLESLRERIKQELAAAVKTKGEATENTKRGKVSFLTQRNRDRDIYPAQGKKKGPRQSRKPRTPLQAWREGGEWEVPFDRKEWARRRGKR